MLSISRAIEYLPMAMVLRDLCYFREHGACAPLLKKHLLLAMPFREHGNGTHESGPMLGAQTPHAGLWQIWAPEERKFWRENLAEKLIQRKVEKWNASEAAQPLICPSWHVQRLFSGAIGASFPRDCPFLVNIPNTGQFGPEIASLPHWA